ncbi:hypothetical protein BGZ47_006587 [Haplosporangium gracile]|nr:hypothetical protein BGZ47_006587 [Haplosporangium gracile]
MDHLSRLPLECLQIILQILDDDNDFPSLTSLLRTNKYLSSAVLPYLYCDPFRKDFHSARSRQMGITKEISSGKLLVRMLLHCLPPTSLPTALSLALVPSTTTKPSGATTSNNSYYSALDYLAHIRHLDMRPWYAEVDCRLTHKIDTSLSHAQQEYTNTDEFSRLYNARPFGPAFNNKWRSNPSRVHFYYHTILHHEVPWSLGFFILEQLQSLTIHRVYNIKHYIDVVHRLKNLEKVHFLLREICENEFNDDGADGENGATEQLENTIQQDVLRFVQEHARLFPGRLKTVDCFDDDRHWADQAFVNGLNMEIYRILPPLARLTHLGQDSWPRFWANPGATDLKNVQRISGRELPETWIETLLNDRPLLEQCRGLKYLELATSQQGVFDWAVQERRDREENFSRIITAGNIHSGRESLCAPGTCQPYGLVPLEQVDFTLILSPFTNNITSYTVQYSSAIDSLAFAFGQTLRQLTVLMPYREYTINQLYLNIGRGWVDLPALTHLELKMAVNRLVVDPLLLTYCPNLTHLRMTDYTKEYSCQDIVPCQLADLSNLQTLKLSGWPALTFHPATLASTPKLTSLELSIGRSTDQERQRVGFIPPLEELNRSYGIQDESFQEKEEAEVLTILPHWSWGWDLPVLTELLLTSEFALRFEFRMMHGCPVLEALTLDIRSTGRELHTRVLSEADLMVPCQASASNDSSHSLPPSSLSLSTPVMSPQRIILPKLKKLSLHGKWMMLDNMDLSQFLQSISPNLQRLQMEEWSFPTLKDLLIKVKENTFTKTPTISQAARTLRIGISAMSAKQTCEVGMKYMNTNQHDCEDEAWEEEQEEFFVPYGVKVTQVWSYTTLGYVFLGRNPGRWRQKDFERK